MANILAWGGGPYHPYKAQAEALKNLLAPMGHSLTYTEERSFLDGDALKKADLLIVMGLDCSGAEKVRAEAWEDRSKAGIPYAPLGDKRARALADQVGEGRPLFLLHAGLLSFDERREFNEIYDGRWILEKSYHPEYHNFPVKVVSKSHPVCQGLSDFHTDDELYCDLVRPTHSTVLLEAEWKGVKQPLAWTRETEAGGRFVYLALGHDMRSWGNPAFQALQRNAVKYLLG